MVAKISTGGNMFGALAYNQNKVDSEEAKVLFSNRMLLGEDGNFSIGECMRSFEMQMPVQLSTKKPILHISINPHPEDVLTDQQLSDIAREYMQKLGYGDQPYLVYKHTDIDRHHIHIVGLRVDESGRPLNDRFEHRRSKQITRELEKKYNLHPAERKERAERPELKKVDYAAGDVKHQVGNTVKAACYGYRFQSFGEYKALLAAYNVCAEEVKGEVNGKPYQGIVYSATNDKGEKVGNPVKASRIGKSVGYEAVQRRMEKSGELIKNGKLKDKREIYSQYLARVKNSVEAPYDYDIIGHFTYCMRCAPYEDKRLRYADYSTEIDAILRRIIERGKILEVNSSSYGAPCDFLPDEDILGRYYELGGRRVSFASDAHDVSRVLDKREKVVDALKKIGFSCVTVPRRGEYISVEL